MSIVDTASERVIRTVRFPGRPNPVTVNPAGTRVYVLSLETNEISVINPASGTVTASTSLGIPAYAIAIAPTGF